MWRSSTVRSDTVRVKVTTDHRICKYKRNSSEIRRGRSLQECNHNHASRIRLRLLRIPSDPITSCISSPARSGGEIQALIVTLVIRIAAKEVLESLQRISRTTGLQHLGAISHAGGWVERVVFEERVEDVCRICVAPQVRVVLSCIYGVYELGEDGLIIVILKARDRKVSEVSKL